jgi:hypothetical protein
VTQAVEQVSMKPWVQTPLPRAHTHTHTHTHTKKMIFIHRPICTSTQTRHLPSIISKAKVKLNTSIWEWKRNPRI